MLKKCYIGYGISSKSSTEQASLDHASDSKSSTIKNIAAMIEAKGIDGIVITSIAS